MDTNKGVVEMIWTYAFVVCTIIIALKLTLDGYPYIKRIEYIADVVIPMHARRGNNQNGVPTQKQKKENSYALIATSHAVKRSLNMATA